ncbi:MAG: addiction module protein [Hydrogenophaga sp.]|nr:addiction module protein [Hydrogenophaga sp.]
MTTLMQTIQQLGPQEKLQLVEDLWDMQEAESVPPMSDVLYAKLQRRLAWSTTHPETGVSMDDMARTLGVRL